jgi:predicted RNA-binding protein YlqC (UPF0109 family)
MKEFIEYIVKNLVDHPEQVEVSCYDGEKGIVVEVKVGHSEVGKVVGSRGVTINAIRTIAMTICARLGRRVRVELVQ